MSNESNLQKEVNELKAQLQIILEERQKEKARADELEKKFLALESKISSTSNTITPSTPRSNVPVFNVLEHAKTSFLDTALSKKETKTTTLVSADASSNLTNPSSSNNQNKEDNQDKENQMVEEEEEAYVACKELKPCEWDKIRLSTILPKNREFYAVIAYWTICSSVASKSSKAKKRQSDQENIEDDSGLKAALFGAADDAQNMHYYLMDKSAEYINQGRFEFSAESVSSMNKETFLLALQNYFNSPVNESSLIYYSGHGFEDAKILLESSQGSFYLTYEEVLAYWKTRTYPAKNKHLLLLMDCCFSGSWVERLLSNGDFHEVSIQASSTPKQKSNDLGRGKGSLFTGIFLEKNDYSQIKIDCKDKGVIAKLNAQQPIAFGFKDVCKQNYNYKSIVSNSWFEMLYPQQGTYFITKDKDLRGSLTIYPFNNTPTDPTLDCLYGKFENIVMLFREGSISLQAEVSDGEFPIKYQLSLLFKTYKVKKSSYGELSIQQLFSTSTAKDKKTDFVGRYFNTSSKKKMIFELQEDQIMSALEFVIQLGRTIQQQGLQYQPGEELQEKILTLYNTLSKMNKTYLVDDNSTPEDEEEEDNLEDYDQLFKQNDDYSLERLEIENLTSKSESYLINYLSKNRGIINLKLSNSKASPMSDLLGKLQIFNQISILDLKLDYVNNEMIRHLEQILIKLPLREISVDFSLADVTDKSLEFTYSPFETLYLSRRITSISISNAPFKWVKDIIKTLDIDKIISFSLIKTHLSEEALALLSFFLSNHQTLKKLTLEECELTVLPSISPLLVEINLRGNNISDDELEKLMEKLKTMKNKYTIDLSNNLLTSKSVALVKNFLHKNSMCLAFQIPQNSIGMVQYQVYISIFNYNTFLCELNISKVFINDTATFTSTLKNQKSLRTLIARDCALISSKLKSFVAEMFVPDCSNIISYIDFSDNIVYDASIVKTIGMYIKNRALLEVVKLRNCFDIRITVKAETVTKENPNIVMNAINTVVNVDKVEIENYFLNSNIVSLDYANWKCSYVDAEGKEDNSRPKPRFVIRKPKLVDKAFSLKSNLKNVFLENTDIEVEFPDVLSIQKLDKIRINENLIPFFLNSKINHITIYRAGSPISLGEITSVDGKDNLAIKLIKANEENLRSTRLEKDSVNIVMDNFLPKEKVVEDKRIPLEMKNKQKEEENKDKDKDKDNDKEKAKDTEVKAEPKEKKDEEEDKEENDGTSSLSSSENGSDNYSLSDVYSEDSSIYCVYVNTLVLVDSDKTAIKYLLEEDLIDNLQKLVTDTILIKEEIGEDVQVFKNYQDYILHENALIKHNNENHADNNSENNSENNSDNADINNKPKTPIIPDKHTTNKINKMDISIEMLGYFNREQIDLSNITSQWFFSSYQKINSPVEKIRPTTKYLTITANYFNSEDLESTLAKENSIEALELDFTDILNLLITFNDYIKEDQSKIKCLIIKNSEFNSPEIIQLDLLLQKLAKTLEEIHLVNTYIDGRESNIILDVLGKIETLTTINLSENYIDNLFAKNLSQFFINNNSMDNIILRNCNLNKNSLIILLDSVNHLELNLMDLSGLKMEKHIVNEYAANYSSTKDMFKIKCNYVNCVELKWQYNKNFLVHLELSFVDLDMIKDKLFKFLQTLQSLEVLSLIHCYKETMIFKLLFQLHRNCLFKQLYLNGCLMNKRNAKYLSQIIKFKKNFSVDDKAYELQMTHLSLNSCQLNDESLNLLLNTIKESSLIYLDLRYNHLSQNSLLSLMKELIYNEGIVKILFIELFKSVSEEYYSWALASEIYKYENTTLRNKDIINKLKLHRANEVTEVKIDDIKYNSYLKQDREINKCLLQSKFNCSSFFNITSQIKYDLIEVKEETYINNNKFSKYSTQINDILALPNKDIIVVASSEYLKIVNFNSGKDICTLRNGYSFDSLERFSDNLVACTCVDVNNSKCALIKFLNVDKLRFVANLALDYAPEYLSIGKNLEPGKLAVYSDSSISLYNFSKIECLNIKKKDKKGKTQEEDKDKLDNKLNDNEVIHDNKPEDEINKVENKKVKSNNRLDDDSEEDGETDSQKNSDSDDNDNDNDENSKDGDKKKNKKTKEKINNDGLTTDKLKAKDVNEKETKFETKDLVKDNRENKDIKEEKDDDALKGEFEIPIFEVIVYTNLLANVNVILIHNKKYVCTITDEDNSIRNVDSFEIVTKFSDDTNGRVKSACSISEETFASFYSTKLLFIWNIMQPKHIKKVETHTSNIGYINSMFLIPNTDILTCFGTEGVLEYRESRNYKVIESIQTKHSKDNAKNHMTIYNNSIITFSDDGLLLCHGINEDIIEKHYINAEEEEDDELERLETTIDGKPTSTMMNNGGRIVSCMAKVSDTELLVSYDSFVNNIVLWDISTCKEIRQYIEHKESVMALCMLNKGTNIESINNIDNQILNIDNHDFNDSIYHDHSENNIEQHDEVKRENQKNIIQTEVFNNNNNYNNNERLFASGATDNLIKIWNVDSNVSIYTITGNNSGIFMLIMSPNNDQLVAGIRKGEFSVFSPVTYEKHYTVAEANSRQFFSLGFLTNSTLLCAGDSNKIELYDTLVLSQADQSNKKEFNSHFTEIATEHTDYVLKLSISHDKKIFTLADYFLISIWSFDPDAAIINESIKHIHSLHTVAPLIYTSVLIVDNHNLLVVGMNTGVKYINLEDYTEKKFDNQVIDGNCLLKFNDNFLIVGNSVGTIHLNDMEFYVCKNPNQLHSSNIVQISLLNNNDIVTCSSDKTIRIFDMITKKCLFAMYGQTSPIGCFHVFDQDNLLAFGEDGGIYHWNTQSEMLIKSYRTPLRVLSCLRIGEEGKIFVIELAESIVLYDVETEKPIRWSDFYKSGQSAKMERITDNVFISVGINKTIHVWSILDLSSICTLNGHQGNIVTLNKVNDDYFTSCGVDQKLIVWKISAQKSIYTFTFKDNCYSSLLLSNKTMQVCLSNGAVHLIDFISLHKDVVCKKESGKEPFKMHFKLNNKLIICSQKSNVFEKSLD